MMSKTLVKANTTLVKFNSFRFLGLMMYVVLIFIGSSCSENDSNKNETPPTVIRKKDKPVGKSDTVSRSTPIINISDTVSPAFSVLSVKDSAFNNIRLGEKLAMIYADKLDKCMKSNKIKPFGPPMAWYKTQKAPFFFEAAIPVNKKPAKLPKGIVFKKIPQTRVIVAHFYGPYEETVQAYQFLKDWLKENKKTPAAAPYEIYVDDPLDENGNLKDPYKVQTDIVFPYR
jgi:effector-binding domain-containing protein